MPPHRSLAVLAIAAIVASCSSSAPNSSSPSSLASPSQTPAATPTVKPEATQFTSSKYGYRLTLPAGWTGGQALRVWDGQGAPGHDSLPVDKFAPPTLVTMWAAAAPFDGTLEEWVAKTVQADADEHSCAEKPESNRSITIGGEPARLLGQHCTGLFVPVAVTVHAGTGFIFAAQDSTGATAEAAVQRSLLTLIRTVEFENP
jgi:hypothetical protein